MIQENNPYIGATPPDSDVDGQPSSQALGDDGENIDDEDIGPLTLVRGQANTVPLLFGNCGDSATCYLSVWLDQNQNGSWSENETVYSGSDVPAGGQLVIAVTHDDHQFHKCDRLIKMEGGRIVSDERQNGSDAKDLP